MIFIGQTTQNRPKISHFWAQVLQKIRDFGFILSCLAYKNRVFQILKTPPEYYYFQLSFGVKIFINFLIDFSQMAKMCGEVLLHP